MVAETSQHEVNVEAVSWDADAARDVIDGYDGLPPEEKARLVRLFPTVTTTVQHVSNTTCIGLSEFIVDVLDASTTTPSPEANLVIGSGTSTPSYSNTALESEITSVDVRTYNDEGEQVRYRAFVPGNAANGATVSEVGLQADGKLLNHALLPSTIEKDQATEATITVILSFTNA